VSRIASEPGRLARLGFTDANRAQAMLTTATLAPAVTEALILNIGHAADPDLALLSLCRIADALVMTKSNYKPLFLP